MGGTVAVTRKSANEMTGKLEEAQDAVEALEEAVAQAAAITVGKEQAFFFYEQVAPAMRALRRPVDELEKMVDKAYWPMPTYADLLFEV